MNIARIELKRLRQAGLVCLLTAAVPGLAQKPLSVEPLLNDDMVLAQRASAAHDPSEALARYLRVLAREPQDVEALTGAGKASLDIGDANAAISFYARAEEIAPRNGIIKAGLGSAMLQLIQPRAALKFFNDAVDYGVPVADVAADRGLAYALRGDSKRARADYQLAIATHPDPETSRRLALTQAIEGDQVGALATLNPLLLQRDKAAWRMRVFIMAIGGDIKGAQNTANAILPRSQAEAITPFLERFSKLRASQQVAAAQFGQFPSEGKQYSEAELFAAAGTPLPITTLRSNTVGKQDDEQGDGITDEAESSKSDAIGRSKGRKEKEKTSAPPETGDSDLPLAKKPDMLAQARKHEKQSVIESADKTEPSFKTRKEKEKEKEKKEKDEKDKNRLEKKASDKEEPDKREKLTGAKKDSEKGTEAKAGSKNARKEPERYWVQVATGAYKPDLSKAWGNLKAKYPALLGRRSAWTTPLNRTNRVLVGPFKSEDEAQAFVNKAAGTGFMTSRFQSAAGQTIEPLKP